MSYLRSAIVIGQYGPSSFELVLLNPLVATANGELESFVLYHSGQFRTPSFAEMARQLSYMEITRADFVPPYSQQALAASCAKEITLSAVWWK